MPEIFQIPLVQDEASFKIRTVLDGVQVVLGVDWNTRNERWHLSTYDANGAPLLLRQPLNINTEIWDRFEIVGLPPGKIMLYDTKDESAEAGFEDLDDRCVLIYQSAE